MGVLELSPGAAATLPKPGEVRNPKGINGGRGMYRRNREIRAALYDGLHEKCDIPGAENKTFFEAGIQTLMYLWASGDRWACTFIANRVWGRVPLDIELRAELRLEEPDIEELSDRELLARFEVLKKLLESEEQTVIDVESVDARNVERANP